MNKDVLRALGDLDRLSNAAMDDGPWRESWQRKAAQNIRRVLRSAAMVDPLEPPTGWYVFGTHAGTDTDLEFYGDDAGTPLWERPIKVEHVEENP